MIKDAIFKSSRKMTFLLTFNKPLLFAYSAPTIEGAVTRRPLFVLLFSLFTAGQSLSTLFFLKQFYCIRTEFLFESEILNILSVTLTLDFPFSNQLAKSTFDRAYAK